MEPGVVAFIAIPSALAVVGFFAGLMSPRHPKAPWILTGVVLIGYVVLIAISYGWYLDCRNCESRFSYDSTRGLEVILAAGWGFFIGGSVIAITWLGAFVPVLVRGFLYWVRRA